MFPCSFHEEAGAVLTTAAVTRVLIKLGKDLLLVLRTRNRLLLSLKMYGSYLQEELGIWREENMLN